MRSARDQDQPRYHLVRKGCVVDNTSRSGFDRYVLLSSGAWLFDDTWSDIPNKLAGTGSSKEAGHRPVRLIARE